MLWECVCVCVCVHVKTWPCVTAANDHLSITGTRTWDYHELRPGTSWTKAWKEKTRQLSMHRHIQFICSYMAEERNVIWITVSIPCVVCCGKTQRRNPQELEQKKIPSTSFLIVNWRNPYIFSPPLCMSCLFHFASLSECGFGPLTYIEKQQAATGRHRVVSSSCCGWAENERVRKTEVTVNVSECPTLLSLRLDWPLWGRRQS